ncbi:Protein-tyrosine phosphatase [Caenorhabditis elegans]|uniref:Protein-tyrosine phosphatase n=1 Tax=Caenorhabditis elegans TaxID=6239 RepID=Q966M2_CAEEL|nr:Protein-tyrosine phosphatase [Caenorhabditis elegans]CCD68090.1 Protein-tyrosine phosphatase [Caenorhabditis elegans]|eukprot:NP_491872.1 Tyrosine-protein phosphatase [Caenorhabditis elegans]
MSKMKRRTNKPRATESANSSTKSSVLDEPTLVERKQQKKQILKFVQRTLEKMPQGLRAEFVGMRRFNDFEKMKAFKEAQEAGKNRYKDVGCLDNNRVKLEGPWPHEYIHANYVATPTNPKRFICTQAPLEKTCADFWYMCYQDKVEYIFMLCNLLEKGARKCFEYFPSKKGDVMDFEEGGQKISVKCESSVTYSFRSDAKANVTATEIVIEGPGEKTRKTTHYHWNDWPDRGVPAADMAVLELLENARPSKGPIVVHCSAGIGRTGSVVMLEYIMDQLLAGQIIDDGEKILVKIREQRNNSIQTDAQYLFVHQVILNYFRKKKLMEETGVQEAYDAFLEQYKKVVV